MAIKTFYVKDEDVKLIEKAQQLLGEESLSTLVVNAVKKAIELEEAKQQGFNEISLQIGYWGEERTKKFLGRLLVEQRVLTGKLPSRDDRYINYNIYETIKGKIVVHAEYVTRWQGERGWSDMRVYPDLKTFKKDVAGGYIAIGPANEYYKFPGSLLDEKEKTLGQEPGEWMDI